jgi:hypothetical protein
LKKVWEREGGMHDPVLLRGEDERTGGRRGEKGVKWTVEEDCWVWMRGADCIRRQNMKNNNKNKNKEERRKGRRQVRARQARQGTLSAGCGM